MIKVKNLKKRFTPGGAEILKGLDLEIAPGNFTSLMGRSGSGKSTFLYILSTLDREFDGELTYFDKNVKEMDALSIHRLRNQDIGFVFQFHYLINELSVIENILLPARKAGIYKEKYPEALNLLEEVGLRDKYLSMPAHLSGGEHQRVAIARALIMSPQFLFADEPTGNLDAKNGEKIIELFKKFNREKGTSITYVTHDKEFGLMAPTKVFLKEGKITQGVDLL